MLKLHTRTLKTPALIDMAWCAARATLSCVCDRALKNAQKLKNATVSAASAFLPQQLSDKLMNCN
jgi:hypothetical protein